MTDATGLGDLDRATLDELLADACFVTEERHNRDVAESCCQQCGDEYDEANPPLYDVARCVYGTQGCSNERHFARGAE